MRSKWCFWYRRIDQDHVRGSSVMLGQGRHASKTRTACLTCKKRRVKCSLELPSCARCLKARRICEGYQLSVIEAQPSSRSKQATPPNLSSSSLLLSAFRATQSEWGAYGHYNHRVASLLGGAFDADLWQRLVVQVADTEPVIRHGIFALGFLFKHNDVSSSMSECACQHCRQALRHFNKSITSFSNDRQQPTVEQTTEVALLSCLIYICLEAYRLNDNNAISLIAKGCSIIAEAMTSGPSTQMTAVYPKLIQLFDRLWLLSSMFGRHVPRPSLSSPRIFDSDQLSNFDTIETARDCLHEITTFTQSLRLRVAQVHLNSMSDSIRSVIIAALQKEQKAILELLQNWQNHLQKLTGQLGLQTFQQSQAWSILTVRYLIAKVMAGATMDPSAKEDEAQSKDFSDLVNVAEEGLTKFPPVEGPNGFSFETCYLPALYLTARTCRVPTIRRKALELMRLSGTKESLWYKPELIRVAARVIELEEGLAVFSPEDQSEPESLNPKPLRFYDVLLAMNYRQAGKTLVDVTYLIYVEDNLQRWRSVQETLTIPG